MMKTITIKELAELTGTPLRTVRYYISTGLLPSPLGRGRSASYSEEHLLRLRIIRQLVEQRVPLNEIRQSLVPMSEPELRELFQREQNRVRIEERARTSTPLAYVSALLERSRGAGAHGQTRASGPAAASHPHQSNWHHYRLAPGVELVVSEQAVESQRPLIEKILQLRGGK
jgi:DNA-binding transcriptional MerR regulator